MTSRRSSGFTIIELLASMAILIIMVLALSRIFGAGADAWRNGNKRIESNNSGRSAMEFMSRELSGLIVSPQRPTLLQQSDADSFLGMDSDRLTFVTLSHTAEFRTNTSTKYRDVQQVHYEVAPMYDEYTKLFLTNRYALYRFVTENAGAASFSAYRDTKWLADMDQQTPNFSGSGAVLAENVRNFEVFITPVGETEPQSDYDYDKDGPPGTIDIYLEVLAEADSIKGSLMPNNQAFLNAATRRYATRIYFQNRAGYAVP